LRCLRLASAPFSALHSRLPLRVAHSYQHCAPHCGCAFARRLPLRSPFCCLISPCRGLCRLLPFCRGFLLRGCHNASSLSARSLTRIARRARSRSHSQVCRISCGSRNARLGLDCRLARTHTCRFRLARTPANTLRCLLDGCYTLDALYLLLQLSAFIWI